MKKITIFYGPNSGFNNLEIANKENPLNVYEMIRFSDNNRHLKEEIEKILENPYDSLIAYSKDFAGLSESGERTFHHILMDFTSAFGIKDIFLQNPTRVIEENISLLVGNSPDYELEIINHKYSDIKVENLSNIKYNYSNHIIGQDEVKTELLTALYTLYKKRNNNKPLVLMFYGPSGVGKTETANFISNALSERQLFRTQVSMFQNQKSIDYLFGETHNSKSFAQDLLERESNVILLDEFDKTFGTVYSAFYQMFDEGIFRDRNYNVDLRNTIIICTSNYRNTDSIRRAIGDPLYFRFNKLIEFNPLSKSSMIKVIDLIYQEALTKLDEEEISIINNSGILEYIKGKVDILLKHDSPNYRQLENIIEDLINTQLVNELLFTTQKLYSNNNGSGSPDISNEKQT